MKYLVIFMLCLTLLVGCSTIPAIEQMPYPEAEQTGLQISMDYSTTDSLKDMWDGADWTTMTFEVEDTVGAKEYRALDMFADASKSPAAIRRDGGRAEDARTSCTSAELLALAE